MELWDIKANALRLMFADTDIQFNKNEFINGSIYDNGNTRDKLVRMNDSIRRAIDLYYQYCGQFSRRKEAKLKVDGEGFISNVLDLSQVEDFGSPSRIDMKVKYRGYEKTLSNVSYYYDSISKDLFVDMSLFENDVYNYTVDSFTFVVYYIVNRLNLPDDLEINELEFNLDSIHIPIEIQRMIPKYIKGEIYEEDEYSMAQLSKSEYIQFLLSYNKKFSNVQTRVKSTFRRS